MRRARVLIPVVFGVFVFAGISLLLARGLTGAGTERAEVLDVVRAQARGDAAAVLARLPACRREPACAQATRDRVARLRRPGAVQVLDLHPVGAARAHAQDRDRARRVARRHQPAGGAMRARAAGRADDRRGRGAALALGPDRRRGGL